MGKVSRARNCGAEAGPAERPDAGGVGAPRLLLALALIATGVESPAADLAVDIMPRWRGADLVVPSGALLNDTGQSLRLTRVALLVSEVALQRADGGTVRLDGRFGFVDFGSGRGRFTMRDVPEGEFVGLEFRVGVPRSANLGDPGRWPAGHALNPVVNGLHWSWQGGYVFAALEGAWREADGGERGLLYHLGNDALLMTVRFAAQLRVAGPTRVALAVDLARVLDDQRLAADDGSESTHSGKGDALAPRLAAGLERAWFWLGSEPATPRVAAPSLAARAGAAAGTPRAFAVPAGFPQPELPVDNPLTEEGVALGRRLFHDPRLSGNATQSCASCHAPERAFSDRVALSPGARGGVGTRNAMPLFNLAWSPAYAWDGSQPRIRDQSLAALRNPIEMDADPAAVAATLAADPSLRAAFAAAFGDGTVTLERIGLALEQFQLTLVAADSRFDRALRGEAELGEEEKRGFELFLTEHDPARGRRGADCFHCHGGALFTDFGFRNNGLAGVVADAGREGVTGQAGDRAKFKTPSLRNVALTAPYMHDGRFATLEDVVAHYDHGVERSATLDPNLAKHPAQGLALTAGDQRALVAFLRTLSDSGEANPRAGTIVAGPPR